MKKGCLFMFTAVLGILSIGLGYYFYEQSKTDPVEYAVEKPRITTIINKTVATGSISPRKKVEIKPQVSGIIEELYIEAGDVVSRGQKIAKVKLIPNQLSINNAKNQVEIAKIRLEEAKRELVSQQEISRKKLDIERARLSYQNASVEEERNRLLFEKNVISEQSYNRFKNDLEITKAAFENTEISATGTLNQFQTEVEIRKQELNSAINNLQLLREGVSKNSKQINNIIVATLNGMVLDVPVEVGASVIERNNFYEGTGIATIADMQSLVFEGSIDESDVGKLKEGMPLVLTIGAIEHKKFDASLEFISPLGSEENGTIKFKIRAAIKSNPEVFLRAGYSANGDIILAKRDNVISLKERDVIFKNDSTYIEIQTENEEFKKKVVQVGLSDGIQIEVINGIDTSMQVKVQKQI